MSDPGRGGGQRLSVGRARRRLQGDFIYVGGDLVAPQKEQQANADNNPKPDGAKHDGIVWGRNAGMGDGEAKEAPSSLSWTGWQVKHGEQPGDCRKNFAENAIGE